MNNTEQRPLLVMKFTPVFQVLPPRFFVPCSECIAKRARPVLELEMFNLHMFISFIPVLGIIITNGAMIIAIIIEHIFDVFGFCYGFKSIVCGGLPLTPLASVGGVLRFDTV